MLVIRAGINKIRIANRNTLIRLLLQKQSHLGLHCLSRPFCQVTSVRTLQGRHFQEHSNTLNNKHLYTTQTGFASVINMYVFLLVEN